MAFSGWNTIVEMSEDYMIASNFVTGTKSAASLNLNNTTDLFGESFYSSKAWITTAEPPLKMRNPVITAKDNKEY